MRIRPAHSESTGVVAQNRDAPDSTSEPPAHTTSALFRWLRKAKAVPTALVLFTGILSVINHFHGVDWGDDFALYMRQAKALAIGNIGEVLSDNRFSVDNSGWSSFSPYSYPWGWPLIVAPVYAIAGLNYEAIKLLEVLAFVTFIFVFYGLTARRTGPVAALIVTLVIALSPSYVGMTDTVLSDMPYLCFVGLTLWWIDRCRDQGLLAHAEHGSLVILGLLMTFTFNVRREGIALVAALAALHLVVCTREAGRSRGSKAIRNLPWKTILVPYATFFVGVVVFHLLLPTVLWPQPQGTGLHNIVPRATYHFDVLAEHLGLKDPGAQMSLFHSQWAARFSIVAFLALSVLGLVTRLAHDSESDVALAVYLCGAALLIGISPYQEGRYLLAVSPFLVLFAYQALPTSCRALRWSNRPALSLAYILPSVMLLGVVFLNARDLVHSTRYHLDYSYTVHGPESADAKQMFNAVRTLTRPDDVVLFFRARAMTLYSDRRAIQGSNLEQLLPRADWYAMAKGSTYSQHLVTDEAAGPLGLRKAWENEAWVLWRISGQQ